jgi:nucleoside-diphosphate-sugar epimerase
LIDGLVRLMNSPDDVTGPINIGNPKEFTILELAALVIELTGSHSRICIDRARRTTRANVVRIFPRRTICSDGRSRLRCGKDS